MKKLVLLGAGGFGREVAASILPFMNQREPSYELIGFIDDGEQYHAGMMIDGYPWLGRQDWILDHKDDVYCTCTIGSAKKKAEIQRKLTRQGVRFATLIGKRVYVASDSVIGPGSVIYGRDQWRLCHRKRGRYRRSCLYCTGAEDRRRC